MLVCDLKEKRNIKKTAQKMEKMTWNRGEIEINIKLSAESQAIECPKSMLRKE